MEKNISDVIEKSRCRMKQLLDLEMETLLLRVQQNNENAYAERSWPLFLARTLKGEKPAAVTFADGRTKQVTNWRMLAETVLEDCGFISECRERLMKVKDSVFGRKRRVLGGDPSGMGRPMKIADGLYFDLLNNTEGLFMQLTHVLDLAG